MIIDYNELLGQALGTCTLHRLLGHGGMGVVYLARQSRPRRTVAVKVLMPSAALEKRSHAEFLARFRREADAIAALDHVNILPLYEYGEQGDIAYLVMPYVTGGTLRDVLEKRGPLPQEEALHIIEQAAAALNSAHAKGIIHRDLKPGNMLFHADGRLLLADFGLAKVLRDINDNERSGQDAPLTSTGTIVGTPEYLSPEQGTGLPIDHRSDIYSLGIVLYQMLAGHVPFIGSSPVAVAIKHALEEPPSLSQANPSISPAVEAVVMKVLAKDPDERYASGSELAEALREAMHNPQVRVTHVPKNIPADHPATDVDKDALTEAPTLAPQNAPTEADLASWPATQPVPLRGPVGYADENDIHGALTEEAPRIPLPQKPEEPAAVVLSAEAHAAEIPAPPQPVQEPQAKPQPGSPPQIKQNIRKIEPRRGCQSLSMMLLGSLLTLLLVTGLFASYLFYIGPRLNNSKNPPPQTHVTPTTTRQAQPAKLSLPPASIPAGPLLYGTNLPGPRCDAYGGQWRSIGNVQVACNKDATRLTNPGSDNKAGIYLDTLPQKKPLPEDYIVQVQVSVDTSSRGPFHILFHNHSDVQRGWYEFVIDPAAEHWQANAYDSGSGTGAQLFGKNLIQQINGTATIDIVIQGNNYHLYVNGNAEGGAASSGIYTGGGIGLTADPGATISFKNLAIYALP